MSTTGPNYEAEYEAFHQNMMDLQYYETILKEMLLEMKGDVDNPDTYPGNKPLIRGYMFSLLDRLPKDEWWKNWVKKNLGEEYERRVQTRVC